MSAILVQFLSTAESKVRIFVSDLWEERMQRYQDIFLERESYSSDEYKRTGPSINISELLGFEGSFGKLDVD